MKTTLSYLLELRDKNINKKNYSKAIDDAIAIVREHQFLCWCGLPQNPKYSPCCSMEHWTVEYEENPNKIKKPGC